MAFTDFDWITGMYITQDLMNKELDNQRYNRSLAAFKSWANQVGNVIEFEASLDIAVRYDAVTVVSNLSGGTHYLSNIDITALSAGLHGVTIGTISGTGEFTAPYRFEVDENARYLSVIVTIERTVNSTKVVAAAVFTHRDPVSW